MSLTSIKISKELRDAIKDLGKKSQTYEDILWKLLAKQVSDGAS